MVSRRSRCDRPARVVDIAGGWISRGWWILWISPVVSRRPRCDGPDFARVVDIAGGWISRGWWISPVVDIAGGLTPVSMRQASAGGGYRRCGYRRLWKSPVVSRRPRCDGPDFARVVNIAGGWISRGWWISPVVDIAGGLTTGGGYRRWLDFARVVDIAVGGYRRWSHAGLDATVRISCGWWISRVVGFRAGGGYRGWWISPGGGYRRWSHAGLDDIVCKWGVLGPCIKWTRSRYRAQVGGAGPLQSKGACNQRGRAISCASGGCWAPAIKGGVRDIVCKGGLLGPCRQRGRARYRVQVGGAAPRARYRVQVGGAGPLQSKGACAISCARYRVQVGGAGPLQSKGGCAKSCASGGCWAPAIKGGVRGVRDLVCKWGVLGPCNQRGRARCARYRVQVGGAGPLQSKGACATSCASGGGCWAPAIAAIKGGVRDIVCKWGCSARVHMGLV